MAKDLPEIPSDFVTEPRSLGTFPADYVNRVLYGDLRDAWRTVSAAPDCPEGVRDFLTLSVPPLPLFFADFDQGAAYRRAWLIAPRIVRVDQATDHPGLRELVIEPLQDLVRTDVADAASAAHTRLALMFPSDWSRSRKTITRTRRSSPFPPGQTPKLDLRLAGTRVEALTVQPEGDPATLPDLPDQVTADDVYGLVCSWVDHWWPRVTP